MRKLKFNKTTKEVYEAYAKKLLDQHLSWWGVFGQKIQNFRLYKKEGTRIVEMMSYPRFKKIISEYYKGAKEYIINGRALELGHRLGYLAGARVERNFNKKTPDWGKTRKMWEAKGEKKGLIYHVDDEWLRVAWFKGYKVRNERLYRFTPAEGNSKSDDGFKKAFTKRNTENPLLRFNYVYKPMYFKR